MPVTIRDVARAAGCSFKTVSRVINGEPYVTDEMRARVRLAITNTGFTPNVSARRLATHRTNQLCVLMVPGLYQQDSAGLGRVLRASAELGYNISFLPYTPLLKQSRAQLFDLVLQYSMDGFVSTPPIDTDDFVQDLISTYKTPLVQIDPARTLQHPTVFASHASAARAITEHLLSLGHRRIAFLQGPPGLRASAERLAGYGAALAGHGLPLDPDLLENGEFTYPAGLRATQRLFSRPNPPTAIFGGNDLAALGALYALQELGYRVPGQVSVCGYDDLPVSGMVYPGLTTVHQPADDLLVTAIQLLIRVLNKEAEIEQQVTLPAALALRGSTAPAG